MDAEHALDPTYAQAIGVDLENLYFSQPDNGKQALDLTDTLVRSGALDVVIIDSVAAGALLVVGGLLSFAIMRRR